MNETGNDTVYEFPYTGEKLNERWDENLKLPLYTKKDDSNWFVAGYFKVKIKGKWHPMLSPKLDVLEHVKEYEGPFKSREECDFFISLPFKLTSIN
jgi:hypothetical protein